ncbi:fibronectin type III domain-containing protein [Anaerostipes sp.]|uniref:fibronectin type III domain-containing protein n=1 Tax=Anaerostipes sp. TaxID=1872530 RepID=UPI0025C35486|nr:fibronectin type III domain-containing protein [Anaerostipes sp.]MBS7008525.1 fibronectin type III domain-containing protein [Anaerostipes sp.]
MKIKRILAALLTACLVITQINMVKAEDTNEDQNIVITNYTGKVIKSNNVVTWYQLSAERNLDNTIAVGQDKIFTIENKGQINYSSISAEMQDKNGAKTDIKVSPSASVLNAGGKIQLSVNFSKNRVDPKLNWTAIYIKDNSTGNIIKKIPFAYDTPGEYDEHNTGASQWSGSLSYGTKILGTLDLSKSKNEIKVSYKNQGNESVPVQSFKLDPKGYFKFSNGTYEYKGSAAQNAEGGTNTFTIVLDTNRLKSNFFKVIENGDYEYYNDNTVIRFLPELVINYEDGCIAGGKADILPLAFYVKYPLYLSSKTTVKHVSRTSSSLKISWKALKDVTGYRIYRSTKKNSGYKYLKQVSNKTTSYTNSKLKSGKTYYYKVRAYRNVFEYRYFSPYSAPLKSGTRPGKPKVTVKKSGRRLKIKYKKVSGASGYRIYIRTGKKGKYKRVKQYTSGKKVSYKSKKLKRKKTYYVKVRAYKTISGKKYFGSYSKAKKVKIK